MLWGIWQSDDSGYVWKTEVEWRDQRGPVGRATGFERDIEGCEAVDDIDVSEAKVGYGVYKKIGGRTKADDKRSDGRTHLGLINGFEGLEKFWV